jgi:hypothetical protein
MAMQQNIQTPDPDVDTKKSSDGKCLHSKSCSGNPVMENAMQPAAPWQDG